MTWHDKAKSIIASECLNAYNLANMPKRRKHVPYRVPEIASALVAALDKDNEYEAKRLFIVYSTGALSQI